MPTVTRDGVALYYESEGDGEPVVFVEDVGLGAWSWGWQHRAVAGPYAALAYDHRGTGRSDAPPGPYSVDGLAADLRAVIGDAIGSHPHLVGLGLGGMVALRYAREHDVRTLTFAGTAADGGRVDESALREMGGAGVEALFSGPFRDSNSEVVDGVREWRADDDAGERGREAQAAAMLGFEAGPLYEVTAPALVVHGGADRVVPAAAGRDLAESLPRGEFHVEEGAGHLVTVERSRPVNDLLVAHLRD